MTPQLYQAIKIMALPLTDLRNTIEEEIERNPALEVFEDSSLVSIDEATRRSAEEAEYFDHASDSGFAQTLDEEGSEAKRRFIEGVLARPESLQEHLLLQLRLQPIQPEEFRIGELLIRNLDERGFHLSPPEALISPEEMPILKRIKAMIQGFDPVGACTSGYRESLLIQIRNHPHPLPGAFDVVEKHFELLEKEKYKDIARYLKKSVAEVMEIKEFLRELDPIPGRDFVSEPARYVIPDAMVKMQDGEYVIYLNDEDIPTLGVNPFFTSLRDSEERSKEKKLKSFVKSSLQEARWFIHSIHQRNATLLKVCKAIIEFQRGFFRRGPKFLVPLTLKDIAKEIGVHEATVSRVTNGKYIQTEWGIYELKFFFSNSVAGSHPGGMRFSKEAVKHMLKEIVQQEQGGQQLTDQKIVELLATKGVKIARRTAAKYRKELEIQSSYRR